MKKILILIIVYFISFNIIKSDDDFYIYGSLGLTDFGLTTADLQTINTSLVNLGFSSSTTTTDNAGVSIKLHAGFDYSEFLAVEGGYTNLGDLELFTTTTGPTESITSSISIDGFELTVLGKFGEDDMYFFARGGFFSWTADAVVTASLGSSTSVLGSGTDPVFGGGVDVNGIRGEALAYSIDGEYLYNYTIGYRYNF